MDIRFLGHSAFRSTDGTTTVLVDPFLTGNPKAAGVGRRGRGRRHPAHARARRPLRRHGRRSPSARARPVLAIVEIAGEIGEHGVENVLDPNLGGTVTFDWGWVKLVPALAHLDDAERDGHTPGRPAHPHRRQARLPPRRHGPVQRPPADRAPRRPRRRRARADRRPLHDGPPRRRDRGRVRQPDHGHPVPLRHVPADRDRRRGVQGRRRELARRAEVICSRRARRTPSGDPRDRPHRGRARALPDARRRAWPTSRASPRPTRSPATGTSSRSCACATPRASPEVVTRPPRAARRGSRARTRWSPSRSSPARPRGAVLDRRLRRPCRPSSSSATARRSATCCAARRSR